MEVVGRYGMHMVGDWIEDENSKGGEQKSIKQSGKEIKR